MTEIKRVSRQTELAEVPVNRATLPVDHLLEPQASANPIPSSSSHQGDGVLSRRHSRENEITVIQEVSSPKAVHFPSPSQ